MRNQLTIVIFIIASCISCKQDTTNGSAEYQQFVGKTMGTYYKVSFKDSLMKSPVMQSDIDELLVELNAGLSTYIDNSVISLLNQYNDVTIEKNDPPSKHFYKVYTRAQEIYKSSDGDFDPTVMPLVNFYGFGYTEKKKLKQLDSMVVRDMLQAVSMDLVKEFEVGGKTVISKSVEDTEIDFSAIAKGYGVDVIGEYLKAKGIQDFLIDIGGEMLAMGLSPKSKKWILGINRPVENVGNDQADILVGISNAALASSGNYRNFYEVDGKKYSHTINPKTGFPERSTLLGASVIATTCMDADAYATACMVKGLEKSKAFIESLDKVEACLIYNENDELKVHFSSGFNRYLLLGE